MEENLSPEEKRLYEKFLSRMFNKGINVFYDPVVSSKYLFILDCIERQRGYEERMRCKHLFSSPEYSKGMKAKFTCTKCGQVEYYNLCG